MTAFDSRINSNYLTEQSSCRGDGLSANRRAVLHVSTSQSQLIERVRQGDSQALGMVYDEHAEAVLAFARRLVCDPTVAEDLLHEVFVTLPNALRRFEGASSLRTFLISIAVNHGRHHVRAAARRRAAMSRFESEPNRESTNPEKEAERKSLARALNEALDELPLDQRVAFVLCEVEERTSREAAEIVDAPEATVRTRLFHAKKKLRDGLLSRGFS